jgi:chemotaxis protein methyltransferase CheR
MRLAKFQAGLALHDDTRSLVASRLAKRLKVLACDMAGYLTLLGQDRTERAICIDLLTSTHTFWLREPAHFADFETRVLPLAAANGKRLRVWCAAAATGEDPYSIALCLLRSLPDLATWDSQILATDISTRALALATEGVFPDDRIAHLTPADRALALTLAANGPPRRWRVKPALKRLVHLARLNLIEQSWPMHGPFEVIFCRNVLGYFDPSTQEDLLERLAKILVPGGTLYVGHHEHLTTIIPAFQAIAPATFLRVVSPP